MNTVIYVKYSNDRNRRFAIRTEILEDGGGHRRVRKLPAYPEGEAHVAAICDRFRQLSAQAEGTRLSFNRCKKIPEGVEFEYLEGTSLENRLLDTLRYQGIEACAQEFTDCLQFIKDLHTAGTFTVTEAFREVFGDTAPAGVLDCAPCTDIDLLCENIYVQDQEWTAIDYEWSFDFPVPANYLLYRMILHFTDHANRGEEFRRFDFMGKMGISAQEQAVYDAMESHFQQYILAGHVPVQSLYRDISSGFVETEDYLEDEKLQIYFDRGDGFSEKDSVCRSMFYETHWSADVTVDLPENTQRLRIDPGSRAAMVHLTALHFDDRKEQAPFILLKGSAIGGWLYFDQGDPYFFIDQIPEGAKKFCITLEIYDTVPEAMTQIGLLQNFQQNLRQKQADEIHELTQYIKELEQKPLNRIRRRLHEHT